MIVLAVVFMIFGSAFLGAECSVKRRQEYFDEPRPYEDVYEHVYDRCFSKLEICYRPLPGNAFLSGESTDYRLLITGIDKLCEASQPFSECAQSAQEFCPVEISHQVDVYVAIGYFLCSSRGKLLLREYQQSSCYNEPDKIFELHAIIQRCKMEVAFGPGGQNDRCQDIIRCSSELVGETCGQAAAQLIDGILNSAVSQGACTNGRHDKRQRSRKNLVVIHVE